MCSRVSFKRIQLGQCEFSIELTGYDYDDRVQLSVTKETTHLHFVEIIKPKKKKQQLQCINPNNHCLTHTTTATAE